MKKPIIILALTLLVLCFLTCKWEDPKAIEVRGSPSFKFKTNLEAGSFLKEMLDSSLFAIGDDQEHLKIFDCINTSTYTIMAYVVLVDAELYFTNPDEITDYFDLLESGGMDVPSFQVKDLGGEYINGATFFSSTVEMPSLDLSEILGGFEFDGWKSELYISGPNILDQLTIEINGESFEKGASSSNLYTYTTNEYPYTQLPAGGQEINVSQEAENVNIRIFIGPEEVITRDILQTSTIKVELAVWIPLKFKYPDGGEWVLFNFTDDGNDLFFRDKPDDPNALSEIFKEIKLNVTLSSNPIGSASFVIEGKDKGGAPLIIKNSFSSKSFSINFTEAQMRKINDVYPFSPEVKIVFPKNAELSIPRNLKLVEIALQTKFAYRMDF